MLYHEYAQDRVDDARGLRRQTVLRETDRLLGCGTLMRLAMQETSEVRAEFDAASIDPAKVYDELGDVLIFGQSALSADTRSIYEPLENVTHDIPRDDSSKAVDRLQDIVDDVARHPERFHVLVQQIVAISKILDPSGTMIFSSLQRTLQKVLDNRPAEVYSVWDAQHRRTLNETEVMEKYVYLEAATRMIRNRCGNRMHPHHWRLLMPMFDDFRNASHHLKNLKTALQLIPVDAFTTYGWAAASPEALKVLNGIISENNGVLRYAQ